MSAGLFHAFRRAEQSLQEANIATVEVMYFLRWRQPDLRVAFEIILEPRGSTFLATDYEKIWKHAVLLT